MPQKVLAQPSNDPVVCRLLDSQKDGGAASVGLCTFCGDETMGDVRPHAHIDQFWAHRNAQRGHTPRENLIITSSG
jgi:hypothetical protein